MRFKAARQVAVDRADSANAPPSGAGEGRYMELRLLGGTVVCCLISALGCAESAIVTRVGSDSAVESADPLDSGSTSDEDAAADLPDGPAPPGLDGGEQPGPREELDGARPGSSDAGPPDVRPAPLDASADAGALRDASPAVVLDAAPPPPPLDAAPALTCNEPQRACGGSCVDVTSSAMHCGGCGAACQNGQTCTQGQCLAPPIVPSGCTARSFEMRAYLFCTETRSFVEARRSCLSAKLDLARVDSAAENEFARQAGEAWLGASDLLREGEWRTIVPGGADRNDGAAVAYKNWAQGEPNNESRCTGTNIVVGCLNGDIVDEDCALMRGDGQWLDVECTLKRNYVCEAY
jgi:hypothetical protein